ncbi:MAG: hypothetical protein EOM52_02090 [Clostridia bacterium]|nr:hypothetical protein [Clostridia bacterium]
MRKLLCLMLACVFLLTAGCSSILNQSYQAVTPHNKLPAAETDSSAIRVEDYPELVNAILYLVSQGEEEGVVRLHNYKRDVERDLTAACEEVQHEDPLGAYAVDGMKHSLKRIVSYYEATITVTYRRTPEQIAAARKASPVTGSGAIRVELQSALKTFSPEIVLRVNYFNEDEAYIENLIRSAYYDTPAAALGLPKVAVSLYPSSGTQRLVEVELSYPESPEVMRRQSESLIQAADTLLAPLMKSGKGPALLPPLYLALRAKCTETGTATAYGALVEGKADSEGMALAFKLLCDLAGIECTVVKGTNGDGAPRFWTIVADSDGHRHIDPSAENGLLLTDAELLERGYVWLRDDYPACGAQETANAGGNLKENS